MKAPSAEQRVKKLEAQVELLWQAVNYVHHGAGTFPEVSTPSEPDEDEDDKEPEPEPEENEHKHKAPAKKK